MGVDLFSNILPRRDRGQGPPVKVLKKVPIFQDLSRREFQKIESILQQRRFASKEEIVREGELSVGMHVIVSGEVEIFQVSDGECTRRLAVLGPGDFFGEQALLDEKVPRTASAIASKSCWTIGLFKSDLFILLEHNPRLGLKIVRRLSEMILTRWRLSNRLLIEARAMHDELEGVPRKTKLKEKGEGDLPDSPHSRQAP